VPGDPLPDGLDPPREGGVLVPGPARETLERGALGLRDVLLELARGAALGVLAADLVQKAPQLLLPDLLPPALRVLVPVGGQPAGEVLDTLLEGDGEVAVPGEAGDTLEGLDALREKTIRAVLAPAVVQPPRQPELARPPAVLLGKVPVAFKEALHFLETFSKAVRLMISVACHDRGVSRATSGGRVGIGGRPCGFSGWPWYQINHRCGTRRLVRWWGASVR